MKESTGQCEMDINELFGLEPIDIEGVLSNPNATIEEMIRAHDYTTALNNIQFAALNSMLNAVTKEKKFIIKRLKLLALKIKTRRIFSKENIEELNQLLEDKDEAYRKLYIDYQDYHNEYSPERTDPCPDYYGLFSLRFEKNPYETVGDMMTLEELDTILCALVNFMEFKLS